MVHNVEGLTCRQQRFCARDERWIETRPGGVTTGKPGASSANDGSSFGFRLPTGVQAWILMVCKPGQTMTICLWSIVLQCLPRLKHFFYPSSDRVASVPLGRLPPWVLRTATHRCHSCTAQRLIGTSNAAPPVLFAVVFAFATSLARESRATLFVALGSITISRPMQIV